MLILKQGSIQSLLMSFLLCECHNYFAAYCDVGFFSSVGLFSSFKGEKTITQKWEVIVYT